jgi:hypothetical protein
VQAYIRRYRRGDSATSGIDLARDADTVAEYATAGVTWWIEDISPYRFGLGWEDPWTPEAIALMRERVRRGPPRVS